MNGLPILLKLGGRPVILVGEGEAADAKRRLVERAGGRIVDGDDHEARIAIVLGEDDAAVAATVAALKARGVLVNAVDRPDLCDFTLPAIVDRSPVLVAISTGGASAGLAAALRQRLEAMLPATLGALAQALYGARTQLRARWPDAGDRRRALGAALAEGGALDPLRGGASVDAWLSAADRPPSDRMIALTIASGDPDDLTLRAARLLAQADTLYHRPDVPAAILDRARADAVRVACDAPPAAPAPGLSLDLAFAS